MKIKPFLKVLALVACMLFPMRALALEAYACYTPSNTTLTFYYDTQRSSRTGMTYDLNTDYNTPGWYGDQTCSSVTRVEFDSSFASARPTSTCFWFASMTNLQSFTGMKYLNTSQVTVMANMFTQCSALSNLDVSHFNTVNVTDMSSMFYLCSGLKSIDLSHFNTPNLTNISNMFGDCSSLKSIDLSSFNTANVLYMAVTFMGCSELTSIDLSSFNTANVQYMNGMFSGCGSLTSLDLSRFNTINVVEMSSMFYDCSNLRTIYANRGWSTSNVTSSGYMFSGCSSLVGGQGTAYDANHVDKAYAHIDGGPSNPGYFTEGIAAGLRGDVNGDGSVDISDVTALIDYLLSGSGDINTNNADCNQDGNINISDVTALIDYLLSGSWN